MVSTDISKAFLQGVTYKELSEMTGEPLRDVCFTLPQHSITALRQLPGYGDFDPASEVLHCVKPGTGSVDAPRAFHLKLAKVTRQQCNLTPTRTDNELLILHRECPQARAGAGTVLVAVMAIHVDDLKITGERDTILEIIKHLETTFGKLVLQWYRFTILIQPRYAF